MQWALPRQCNVAAPWPALGAKNGSTKTVSFVLSYVQCIRSAARQETDEGGRNMQIELSNKEFRRLLTWYIWETGS